MNDVSAVLLKNPKKDIQDKCQIHLWNQVDKYMECIIVFQEAWSNSWFTIKKIKQYIHIMDAL